MYQIGGGTARATGRIGRARTRPPVERHWGSESL